jgi:ABC-type molybdate transport system substrate-binding protein
MRHSVASRAPAIVLAVLLVLAASGTLAKADQTSGVQFTVPEIDNLLDFHGDPLHARLILYIGGNYYFAVPALVEAFEQIHPRYRQAIYWETIPPGILLAQARAGGTITVGGLTWTARPDVYLAGYREVQRELRGGLLEGPAVPYVTNTLTIMVARGNPRHIQGLADLADPNLLLAMPNPQFEGIAQQIQQALQKAGGPALVSAVYGTKVNDHSTLLTQIHHRQTPLWIVQGRVQAGVTWQSEALYQEEAGHPVEHVNIPAQLNSTGVYAGAVVKGAPHAEAAREWLQFLRSAPALAIFEHYGFKAYRPSSAAQ